MSKIVKSTQSCSNGHLPYHCLYMTMHDVACEFACAVAMGANVPNFVLALLMDFVCLFLICFLLLFYLTIFNSRFLL